jgi:hypothetical protein
MPLFREHRQLKSSRCTHLTPPEGAVSPLPACVSRAAQGTASGLVLLAISLLAVAWPPTDSRGGAGPKASREGVLSISESLPIVLRLDSAAIGSRLRVGDQLPATVVLDVRLDGHVVVAKDTPGILRVSYIRKRDVVGSPCRVRIRAESTRGVDDSVLRLDGQWELSGEDLSVEAIGTAWAFCCLGWFIPGGEVTLARSTAWTGFVTRGQTVRVKSE